MPTIEHRDGFPPCCPPQPEAGSVRPLGTGLTPSAHPEPVEWALTAWIEQVRRVTDAATLILLLIAALVFVLPSLGASLP